jgi:hypothetical protein
MFESYSHYYDPEIVGSVLLSSIAEVMGENWLNSTLDLPLLSGFHGTGDKFSFETVSNLQIGLEQAYGHRGGQGLALRFGRIFFNNAMRMYGGNLGLSQNTFQLQSIQQKVRAILQVTADLFHQFTEHQVVLEETQAGYLWRLNRCPFCRDRKASAPICHFTIGMLQEALLWVSGGKIYQVEETACLACGDPECLFMINMNPLA